MSELLESLKKTSEQALETVRRQKNSHPSGYEPGVEDRGDGTATAVSQPMEPDANADEKTLIAGWGLDPEDWKIVGSVNCRRWQTYDERWLHYYKADLVRKSAPGIIDYDELVEMIKKHKPHKAAPGGDEAFVVCIADPQIGKSDGDGVEGTVARMIAVIDQVEERIAELRTVGRKLGRLYVFGMGDIIEGCDGHYAQQTFTTQLNRRDQIKVARRLILKSIQRWAPLFDEVVVAAVGGNHGENRKDGKSYTDFADNDDVAIFEQVAEILAENPDAYKHVRFQIPNDELSLTLDVNGTITTITHGHLGRSGTSPAKKQIEWWKKQAHGMQPAGDSVLLLTAHYHHMSLTQSGAKTHIQCPALEDRSDWWTNTSGEDSPPGLLTLVVGNGTYRDVQVLDGKA